MLFIPSSELRIALTVRAGELSGPVKRLNPAAYVECGKTSRMGRVCGTKKKLRAGHFSAIRGNKDLGDKRLQLSWSGIGRRAWFQRFHVAGIKGLGHLEEQ